jgi:hypothetical protein
LRELATGPAINPGNGALLQQYFVKLPAENGIYYNVDGLALQ